MEAIKMPKLDLKDRKILAELDWNARITNSEIARRVGLSKKSVEYRIKKLENLGVVEGYYCLIDFQRLGYSVRRVEVKLKQIDRATRKKIEDYITKDPDIGWALWFLGHIDLGFDIWSKSLAEFKKIINRFKEQFGPYILSVKPGSSIGFEQYPHSFILGKNDKRSVNIEETPPIELDKIDIKILKILAPNARISASEIARKIGSDYKKVSYRIRNLEKKKVLLGYRAIVNSYKLGYNYYKLILYFNSYSAAKYQKLKNYFKSKINTVYIVDCIDNDFDVELMIPSDLEFFELLDQLKEDFGDLIREVEYWIFKKTIKVNYLPNIR